MNKNGLSVVTPTHNRVLAELSAMMLCLCLLRMNKTKDKHII
jgi:hypothetical protein